MTVEELLTVMIQNQELFQDTFLFAAGVIMGLLIGILFFMMLKGMV